MTTTERLARFETAQEILGFLVAARSEWIYKENKKAHPDSAKIAQWEAEQDAFSEQEDRLLLSDSEGIERVIATYGPEVRGLFSEARKTA